MRYNFVCLTVLLSCPALSFADNAFQVQGFPLPAGYISFENPSINQSGQIAVTAYNSLLDPTWGEFEGTPFLWSNGQLNTLPLAGSVWATTTGINNAGEVVGYAADSSGNFHPVAWTGSSLTYLPQGEMSSGEALAINDSGQIAGAIFTTPTNILSNPTNVQATVWTGGTLSNLGNFGANSAMVTSINNQSSLLVYTSNGSLLYQNGKDTPISIAGSYNPGVTALNNVGQTTIADVAGRADYIWQNGNTTPLGFLPDTMYAVPEAITDGGIAVGTSYVGPGYTEVPTLWDDGIPYDLNSLIDPDSGWTLATATDITDDGTIVGIGGYGDSQEIYILTPTGDGSFSASGIPEPASLALLGMGSAILLKRRR